MRGNADSITRISAFKGGEAVSDSFYVPQLKIPSKAWLQKKINRFENWCRDNGHHITWSALAVYLGVTTETLRQYKNKTQKTLSENEKIAIWQELSRARAICQLYAHDKLYDKETMKGAQFDLAANFGMRDRQQLDLTSDGVTIRLVGELEDLAK